MQPNLPPILPTGDPYWVPRAIEAVTAFQPDLDRVGIAQLLSMWRHADRLTFDQTAAVVAHFAEPARCPGCGAQLPGNAGCQVPGCDGIPYPLAESAGPGHDGDDLNRTQPLGWLTPAYDQAPADTRTLCGRCGQAIERIPGKDPYWRHLGPIPDPVHAATPTPTWEG